ncbi:hypothetical protein [Methylomonas sp. AM2-LC]|uniref:hypothetical protein n=1 Tax=Methylomonas sp. AM2-LC TaxID=3153301 RepID=UPI003264EA28
MTINMHTQLIGVYNTLHAIKYKEISILILLWGLLYIPYIIHGGMLGDDAGILIIPNSNQNLGYWHYQWSLSSQLTMTARPISAILHGLCNWFFGLHFWAYHFVNLTLFLSSILLFYLSIKRIFSAEIALLASLLALVYPCSSSTVFSSIMMNSNLAALFWTGALYLSTKKINFKYIIITICLLFSCLSYESFIPLFILNIVSSVFFYKYRLSFKVFLIEALPAIFAMLIFGVYKFYIESILFNTHYSRINIFSFYHSLLKLFISLNEGVKIALFDSIEISNHALSNIELLSIPYLFLVTVVLSLISYFLYKIITKFCINNSYGDYLFFLYKKQITIIDKINFFLLPVILFIACHLIYVFSYYYPVSAGFNNRTLGAIRFSTSLAAACIFITLFNSLNQVTDRKLFSMIFVCFFAFFSMSVIGQREAWIAACKFNDNNISKINAAIYEQGLQNNKDITLIAMLPRNFPEQVNNEPIFSESWDLTNSLSISNPSINFTANVNTAETTVDSAKVILHSSWQAIYPFWLYHFKTEKLYRITSEDSWRNITR